MQIREIMTPDVITAELNSTLEEIATIMRHEDIGAVPIVDDDELVGIVTDRDIVLRCVAEGCDPGESTAEDILTEGPITISPDNDVEHAADLMSTHKIRRLPVVHNGHLQGMVSLGDIAVKQPNTRISGSVLEEVSSGVKHRANDKNHQQRVISISPHERAAGAHHHTSKRTG